MGGRLTRDGLLQLSLPERHEVIQAHLSRRGLLRGAAVLGAAGAVSTPLLWSGRASAADSTAVPVTARWVAFGSDPQREMSVCWQVPSPVAQPVVRYGPHGSLDASAPAQMQVVSAASTASGPSVQYYLSSRLTGLAPDTTYTYQAVHAGGSSEPATFATAPAKAGPFRFTACGDQGATAAAVAVDGQVAALRPAFHLMAGDLSYAEQSGDGTSVNDYLPERWTRYLAQTDPLASLRPWMVAPGNHEIEPILGPDGYAGFRARFALPDNGPGSATGVYSFRYGNVGVIALDANDVTLEISAKHGYTAGAQTVWLRQTLATMRADSEVDFVVVFFHQCAFATDSAHGSDGGVRAEWVPLFDQYSVDLVINGHNHACERTDPIRGGQATTTAPTGSTVHPATQGTTYVVVGGGGISLNGFRAADSYLSHPDGADATVRSTVWQEGGTPTTEMVGWSRVRFTGYSFLVVDVEPSSPARAATMRLRLVDSSGRELDSVSIVRGAAGATHGRALWLPVGVGAAVLAAGGGAAYAVHRSHSEGSTSS